MDAKTVKTVAITTLCFDHLSMPHLVCHKPPDNNHDVALSNATKFVNHLREKKFGSLFSENFLSLTSQLMNLISAQKSAAL
ncbi:hypothetical protein ACLKA7_015436 [Drosophila subpalustris]